MNRKGLEWVKMSLKSVKTVKTNLVDILDYEIDPKGFVFV